MNKKLNLYKIYKNIFNYWFKNKLLNYIRLNTKKKFIIYDGPPSMNGEPGIHHIFSRIIKDIFYRFYTMNNYKVINKLGWDTHGLPIEIAVEKKLNINKNDIGKKISIKYYNKKCKKLVEKNFKKWVKFTNKIGYFFNKKNYYITNSSKYIESIWWIIKELYKKKLLYKDYKVLPYSPIAGTSISHQELNFPDTHKKIKDLSVYVLFKLKNKNINFFKKKKIYLLSWTTTPWTLPSNSALLVNKNIYYILVKTLNKKKKKNINIIISEKSINNVFKKKKKYKILKKFLGKKLIGLNYKQIINWFKPIKSKKKKFKIFNDKLNLIKEDFGTGIIHISPTFGKEDYEIAKKNNISKILFKDKNGNLNPIVDKNGKFIKEVPYGLGGKYIKEKYYKNKENKFNVDKKIIDILKKENKIFKVKKYIHIYPHCWRTNKPIIYYPIKSWFINLKKIKNLILKLSYNINWCSVNLIKKKFEHWLKNIKNWNISRSRYWGTPLPIWKTKNKKNFLVIGSFNELNYEINKSIKLGFMKKNPFKKKIINNKIKYNKINMHKDFVDNIILSSKNGDKMYREFDVIDVWFDSGACTYAQYHYPFENKNLIDKNKIFPCNFISEGIDQIRGWFFTLHVISSIMSKSISYKNILPLGIILDKNGKKMSKSKGNTLDPFIILKKYGPDCIRWYIIYNNLPWENIKFNIENIQKIKNKFFNTLYNTYLFFYNYSKIDNYNFNKNYKYKKKYIDKWIISKLNNLLFKTYNNYLLYNITYITRDIYNFVLNDLSNWYVRLSRKRFWKNKYDNDKKSAYYTLYICLKKILEISYPITPFFMEYIYIKLSYFDKNYKYKKNSIILNKFPKYKKKFIDKEIENNMLYIKKYSSIILSLRKKKNIKVRQPLNNVYIVKNKFNKKIEKNKIILNLLKKEVNIKNINFIYKTKINKYIKKKIKLNYKILGPKYKTKIKKISKIISKLKKNKIEELEKKKYIYIKLFNKKIRISIKDIYIYNENINENIIMYTKNDFIIIIDTKITNSLKKECWVRDFIRIIQKLRKDNKYKITDRINIFLYKESYILLHNIIKKYIKKICKETLSYNIIKYNNIKYTKICYYNKNKIYFLIKKK
ncbi:MAG: isoleucine--tRNA ligase [Candidatus Shikimatogenerans bostrichidophilus]|nr:MAG: isoleucine--tRNA ligase [Candidatus Shikimatogenerans bostrichidophilus]